MDTPGAVFGDEAPEAFMAWNYARYIGRVAAAGKSEYPLPMFVNAQLPAPLERAGENPSGGPQPLNLGIYRAGAPALDFFSPDIYWPNFEYWLQRFGDRDNPLFVPEAKLDVGPFSAFYAYGEARAFGFSPFAVDTLPDVETEADDSKNPLAQSYAVLGELGDILPQAQREARTRGLVLHANSPRPSQTVSLGGYLFTAALARSWPARNLLQDDGAKKQAVADTHDNGAKKSADERPREDAPRRVANRRFLRRLRDLIQIVLRTGNR